MTTSAGQTHINIADVQVQVVRKPIKNLHLGVYPPNGRVRVAVPLALSDEAVHLAVIRKLGWIRQQQARFEAQPRQSAREMVAGESHYYWGRRYRLQIVETTHEPQRVCLHHSTLALHVPPSTTADARHRLLQRWYRQRLREQVPPLLAAWQTRIGVQADAWGIKHMKTRWGTCNPEARRIWLNLELVKKPVPCLEYVLVHELCHLIERQHNERFVALMNLHLPQWRLLRDTLNAAPLGYANWTY